jgi:DNA (cytosine-5)-methyltransferase 1
MKRKPHLTVIDLFAGCGGLSLGLEQAGFEPLLFSELNKDAADTYEMNRKVPGLVRVGDIYGLTNARLAEHKSEWKRRGVKDVDLVCGGPPCQGYSGIGHRRSYKVERQEIPSNHLYKEMIRVIEAVRPKAFLFENVRGLMTGRWTADGEKGEIFRDVLASFQAVEGYEVLPTLVQAKDYGVPQNRPRVLIVGYRKDIGMRANGHTDAVTAGFLPGGGVQAPDLIDVWDDLVDDDYLRELKTTKYPSGAKSEFQRLMRTRPDGTVARKGEPVTEQDYSDHSPRIVAKFKAMHKSGGEIPKEFQTKKFAQRLLTPRWGPQGPNITATSLSDDFVHYVQPRNITVREWARLQCFPDWYQFSGPRTTGGLRRAGKPTEGIWDREVPKYTQIGNAVPVRLACAIGQHLHSLLSLAAPSLRKG